MRLPTISRRRDETPQPPFSINVTIGIEDRIAGWFFIYKHIYASGRRRILYIPVWLLIGIVLATAFIVWQENSTRGFNAFADWVISNLFGLWGLPVLILVVPLTLYYLLYPAIVRRRLWQWFRAEQIVPIMPLSLRFEPHGLIAGTGRQFSAIDCRRIAGLTENPDYLMLRLTDVEDTYILPRKQLAPEQIEKIGKWVASCQAGSHAYGPGAQTQFAPIGITHGQELHLCARFVRSAADKAALLTRQMERPAARLPRRRAFIGALIAAVLIPPLVIVALWLLDPSRVPLRYAAPLFAEMFVNDFWKWTLLLWILIVVIALIHPRLRRAHARQLGAQLHARYRIYEQEVRLYDDRLDLIEDGLYSCRDWSAFDDCEWSGDYLFLPCSDGNTVQIPLRAFDPQQKILFESVVSEKVEQARSGKGTT